MIKLKIKEHFQKCLFKLKGLEQDVFLYQDEYNECFILTNPKNNTIINSILTVIETETITSKERFIEIYNHYRVVNKKSFGNKKIIEQ